jgi:hypothetical protein
MQQFGSVKDGHWLVRWLQLHCFVNMLATLFRPLNLKDLFNTRKKLFPESSYSEFQKVRLTRPVELV